MKSCLLDTSFLIALERECSEGEEGPAHRTLIALGRSRLFVSPVTVAELLEGAADVMQAERTLSEFHAVTIDWKAACRAALNQSRASQRMGENDAWQAALAVAGSHTLVGQDAAFEGKRWLSYLDCSKG